MVGVPQVIWHGTNEEAARLLSAVQNNCECETDKHGAIVKLCSSHKAMVDDQRFMNGVLAYRQMRQALLHEEWTTDRKQ